MVPWGERLVALFGDARDDANGKTTSAAVCEATERWRPGEVVDRSLPGTFLYSIPYRPKCRTKNSFVLCFQHDDMARHGKK